LAGSYRALKPERIIETQRRLRQRIARRFPSSGLSEVGGELLVVAEAAARTAGRIRRPNLPLRFAVGVLMLLAAALAVAVAGFLHVRSDLLDALNLAQFAEATLGSIVFLGAAVWFLISMETQLKRRRALAALHELRAIAHVVDMHQLAKDPEGLARRAPVLSEGPKQTTKTLYDLNRYLNYCNELLAIVSKVAAIYVQNFPDAQTVAAVDQIEMLCSGLSQKISQKIIVLEQILDEPPAAREAAPRARDQEGADA
jgi:hypothetical protein